METKEDHKKRNQDYRNRNRVKINSHYRHFRSEVKLDCFRHYSQGKMVCACCGETEIKFLSLDHINGHENECRNKHGHYLGGTQLYLKLKRMKYPEGFQVLCFNCNCAKGFYGVCPHQEKVEPN